MPNLELIAEIGINHDGSFDKAKELIAASADSGADAIKFQYRNLKNTYASDMVKEIGDEILLQEIHKNYLSPDEILKLSTYAKERRLDVGISFFTETDIHDFQDTIAIFDFFKIPSAELTNKDLIDAILALKRHLYISTGCHTEVEIETAFNHLPKDGWSPMHCISNYPVSMENARLGYLTHLKNRWNRGVGYSSHDANWEVCLLAMQLGADVIERHITLDTRADGLDHSSSSTPGEFAKISAFSKAKELVLGGNGPRVPNQGELLNRQNIGRSFYADGNLPIGHILSQNDVSYRAPNVGLNSLDIDKFLGKPLIQPVAHGTSLVPSMFTKRTRLSERVTNFARNAELSLPVRLHDLSTMQAQFPIGAFEFHLSFGEVLSEIDLSTLDRLNRYSIHLPDYINSKQLIDPFSKSNAQREESRVIIERTVQLSERIQDLTGHNVPIVGSFSAVHLSRDDFFQTHADFFAEYQRRGVTILPQWLPPIAWYFGGSVKLNAMNEPIDTEFLKQHEMPFCLDISHLIMGRNCYNFSATAMISDLLPLVGHIHIADAAGIDGEGLAIGEGEPENLELIRQLLDVRCLKVIEVWQGHLDQGAGFQKALTRLEELYGK